MKSYLKEKRPKITLIFILVLFLSNVLILFFPEADEFILLYPTDLNQPWKWYKLITYPLYVGGLWNWLHNALVMVLTGYIIESKLSKGDIITLILLSSILGGLLFMIFNQDQVLNAPIATPTMISWGYWSAAVLIGLFYWKALNPFEKVIIILCVISVLSIENENTGFLIGQITVIIAIMILTTFKIKKSKRLENHIT